MNNMTNIIRSIIEGFSKSKSKSTHFEVAQGRRKEVLFTFLDDLSKKINLGNEEKDFADLKSKIENNRNLFQYFSRLVGFIKNEGKPVNESIEYVLDLLNKKSFKDKDSKDLKGYKKIRLPNYDKIGGIDNQKYFIFYWKDENDFGIKHFQLRIGSEDIQL